MNTAKIHLQNGGDVAACGVVTDPRRMVRRERRGIQNNELRLEDVTCKRCKGSRVYYRQMHRFLIGVGRP
jgi:hypothetical protein